MDNIPEPRQEHELEARIDALHTELTKISGHHFLQSQATWPRMIGYTVVRGMAFGFGSLIGATVIVYIAVSILTQMVSHIDFIPVLGDWVTKILEIVETKGPAN